MIVFSLLLILLFKAVVYKLLFLGFQEPLHKISNLGVGVLPERLVN